ncbi:MAG: hypothetical protein RMJ19_00355 [Gemmatales bacterium]|nr:hypothetical protein [Gemmatales bacterium]MCS7158896.1 hypothetical protein [Gemmatales bacterium]MDW8174095.1 hypothetical protein [Gemmatales bacterium]MDW8223931.1 hypothetical protein [Gemmatales bacterium]
MKRMMVVVLAAGLGSGCASCPTHPWLSRLWRRDCPPEIEAAPATSLLVPAPAVPESQLPPPRISEMMPTPRLAPEQPAPPHQRSP